MKYSGKIGYVETIETSPGVWEEVTTERYYKGDVLKNSRRWENNTGSINDNINITNSLSIISDSYAATHFQFMRYAEWMGAKWKITNVDVNYPRYTLSLGGVYNVDETGSGRSSSDDAWK